MEFMNIFAEDFDLKEMFTSPVSLGMAMGLCVGVVAKKVAKTIAFYIGVTFILIQILKHLGYLSVDWNKVETDVKEQFNSDNVQDWTQYLTEMSFVQDMIGTSTGFVLGFCIGFRFF